MVYNGGYKDSKGDDHGNQALGEIGVAVSACDGGAKPSTAS
jgi:hypothetical protein